MVRTPVPGIAAPVPPPGVRLGDNSSGQAAGTSIRPLLPLPGKHPPIVNSITPAAPADVGEIHAMVKSLAEYEQLAHLCIATRDDLADALFGARPAAEALVARTDGEVAGFALYFATFSTFLARRGLWLEDLFVKPAMRNRGVGRALLVALAGIACERNCGRFEWAVLDWNASAIGFYQRLGATLVPDWRLARVTGDALAAMARQ